MKERISLQQNLINHVGLVLDASLSMKGKATQLISVADELVDFLKEKSQSYDQETRLTIYIFGSDTQAACYDIDVLRSPSIRDMYKATGPRTALIDASITAIEEMKQTATLHGDHAFLLYILTDGQENNSTRTPQELRTLLEGLPENWTPVCFVPNRMDQRQAVKYGFDIENTTIWDAQTSQGVRAVGSVIQNATETYYQARQSGIRGTNNLFTLNLADLTNKVQNVTLEKVDRNTYVTFTVDRGGEVIKDAVEKRTHRPYALGSTFYQLTKAVEVQPNKIICIRDKVSGDLFTGDQARGILGLGNTHQTVTPRDFGQYEIFIQSTAPNRKLVGGTTAIIFL